MSSESNVDDDCFDDQSSFTSEKSNESRTLSSSPDASPLSYHPSSETERSSTGTSDNAVATSVDEESKDITCHSKKSSIACSISTTRGSSSNTRESRSSSPESLFEAPVYSVKRGAELVSLMRRLEVNDLPEIDFSSITDAKLHKAILRIQQLNDIYCRELRKKQEELDQIELDYRALSDTHDVTINLLQEVVDQLNDCNNKEDDVQNTIKHLRVTKVSRWRNKALDLAHELALLKCDSFTMVSNYLEKAIEAEKLKDIIWEMHRENKKKEKEKKKAEKAKKTSLKKCKRKDPRDCMFQFFEQKRKLDERYKQKEEKAKVVDCEKDTQTVSLKRSHRYKELVRASASHTGIEDSSKHHPPTDPRQAHSATFVQPLPPLRHHKPGTNHKGVKVSHSIGSKRLGKQSVSSQLATQKRNVIWSSLKRSVDTPPPSPGSSCQWMTSTPSPTVSPPPLAGNGRTFLTPPNMTHCKVSPLKIKESSLRSSPSLYEGNARPQNIEQDSMRIVDTRGAGDVAGKKMPHDTSFENVYMSDLEPIPPMANFIPEGDRAEKFTKKMAETWDWYDKTV